MVTTIITGLDDLKRNLSDLAQRQVPFAASRALNNLAFIANEAIKEEMNKTFGGGATAFTLRAFRIEKANKTNLSSAVILRDDAPEGGTSYYKALHHLFTGGTRDWKKIEGLLRGLGLIPAGMMAVPGGACPLDNRGNMRKAALNELLGVIGANVRNLRVFRRAGKTNKQQKGIGYFVILPGDRTHLHSGVWKRIETGGSSVVKPMIMYVQRGHWRQIIDLQKIGVGIVADNFDREFAKELTAAVGSAR